MNLNELAKEVSKREGGKQNLSIAQIKEVIRHIKDIIREELGLDMQLFSAKSRAKSKSK